MPNQQFKPGDLIYGTNPLYGEDQIGIFTGKAE